MDFYGRFEIKYLWKGGVIYAEQTIWLCKGFYFSSEH